MYFLLCFSIILTFGKISTTSGPFKSHFPRQHNTFWILQGVTLKDEDFQRKHSKSHGILYSYPTHLWNVMYCWGSSQKSPGREITVRDVSKNQEMLPTSRDWSASLKELQFECELSLLGACVWILGLQLVALIGGGNGTFRGCGLSGGSMSCGMTLGSLRAYNLFSFPIVLSASCEQRNLTSHLPATAALPSPSLWILPLESEAGLNPSSLNCFW